MVGAADPPPAAAPSAPAPSAPSLRGELSYVWQDFRAVRVAAVIAAIGIVLLSAWLVVLRPSGGGEASGELRVGGGPVATSQLELAGLAGDMGQAIYWAGPMPGTSLEATLTSHRSVFVRYLTPDAGIGDPSSSFLTVGTYPDPNAFSHLRSYARHTDAATTRVGGGGLAVVVPDASNSVFFAYPGDPVQVEVYDPSAERALSLVKSGVVAPIR